MIRTFLHPRLKSCTFWPQLKSVNPASSPQGVFMVWVFWWNYENCICGAHTGTLTRDPSVSASTISALESDGDPEHDGKLTSVQLVACAPQKNEKKGGDKEEKWVEWSTTGIEVRCFFD